MARTHFLAKSMRQPFRRKAALRTRSAFSGAQRAQITFYSAEKEGCSMAYKISDDCIACGTCAVFAR